MSVDAPAAWDRHAQTFAKLFAPLTSFVGKGMLSLVDRTLPPNARILEIACGTGALAIPLLERAKREHLATGGAGILVVTDFSAAMVECTRRAASGVGGAESLIQCEVQNGEALTFADASFDAVFSCFGIFLFDDRRAGWSEAARVLKPGGKFVTSVWLSPANNPMFAMRFESILKSLPKHLVPTKPSPWIAIGSADTLIAEVSASAPFVDVRCYEFHATFIVPNWREHWDSVRDSPIMGALLKKCTPDEHAAVKASVLKTFCDLAGGPDMPLVVDSVCNLLVATRR